jgi:hypothetical protein
MSPEDRIYLRERATLERELAKSAPDQLTGILHLEIAARYEAIVDSVEVKPRLRLVSSRGQ